ncbi:hypothetical protein N7520_001377 [Penicillium odoratum]|uniref:uncharacterized protein n=1 Tax=Penicillium odoratum TaxID=1167516 RepID=UPI0025478030|nr:uncharacterized protein N7520_001377 [Penicillium odoratum]KAJ5778131.1 hypothetical protein N7520_001377 [Penicillium odoratum]
MQVTLQTGDKRKRGRPRKYPVGTSPKPSADGPKRGRGRPRKNPAEENTATATKKDALASEPPKRGRGRPPKDGQTPKSVKAKPTPTTTPTTTPNKIERRGRPRKSLPANGAGTTTEPTSKLEASASTVPEEDGVRSYWLMKAEPESRLEKGVDVKFSIDDLAAADSPEPWDGVRNAVARNLMREMKKGDYAFFYHSNCKTPGIVGVMEIVQEHSPDGSIFPNRLNLVMHLTDNFAESAFNPKHPYYDPKASRDIPKWVVVHVEFRCKLKKQVTLQDLKTHAQSGKPLENLQTIKQSRLSVSSVTPAQWRYILELAGEDPDQLLKTEFVDDQSE